MELLAHITTMEWPALAVAFASGLAVGLSGAALWFRRAR
jgi:hypothetical protein